MPDEKDKNVIHGVYKVGDKYYCAACDSSLQFGRSCPNCLKEFDWERIKYEAYR